MTMHDLITIGASREQMAARLASLSIRPDVEVYYFGCLGEVGHFFHIKRGMRAGHDGDLEFELGQHLRGLDGAHCWNGRGRDGRRSYSSERDETEGLAIVRHHAGTPRSMDGWTTLAFWDRSIDRRGASNSLFITRGHLSFAQIVRASKHQWPQVWARFTFGVVEVDENGRPM